jgi:hypothetical protein
VKIGVQESRELLIAVNTLVIYLIKQFKDGVQMADFVELYAQLMADEDLRQKMLDAYLGVSSIPAELKDIDLRETVELSSLQLSYLPEIFEAIKE